MKHWYAVTGCKLKQNANWGLQQLCKSCRTSKRRPPLPTARPPPSLTHIIDCSLGWKETHIQSHNPWDGLRRCFPTAPDPPVRRPLPRVAEATAVLPYRCPNGDRYQRSPSGLSCRLARAELCVFVSERMSQESNDPG